MSLSIITPHHNDLAGLQRIHDGLCKQTNSQWEWIVVDDHSESACLGAVERWHQQLQDGRIQLIAQSTKTNASVCRNVGMERATNERLVFLDSDDWIAEDFVANRILEVEEFMVFKNYTIINKNHKHSTVNIRIADPLDQFLQANFIWQTSCVLWNKAFLTRIGKFDVHLERLQDVELSIRALFEGSTYQILDNKVDFFYQAKPIRSKKDIVRKSCHAVNYLITKLHDRYPMDAQRRGLMKAYYYACTKNLQRTRQRDASGYVKASLKLFHQKNHINRFQYHVGSGLLRLYRHAIISDRFFMKANRYFFK